MKVPKSTQTKIVVTITYVHGTSLRLLSHYYGTRILAGTCEVEMKVPKSTQTGIVGIITYMVHLYACFLIVVHVLINIKALQG